MIWGGIKLNNLHTVISIQFHKMIFTLTPLSELYTSMLIFGCFTLGKRSLYIDSRVRGGSNSDETEVVPVGKKYVFCCYIISRSTVILNVYHNQTSD